MTTRQYEKMIRETHRHYTKAMMGIRDSLIQEAKDKKRQEVRANKAKRFYG